MNKKVVRIVALVLAGMMFVGVFAGIAAVVINQLR